MDFFEVDSPLSLNILRLTKDLEPGRARSPPSQRTNCSFMNSRQVKLHYNNHAPLEVIPNRMIYRKNCQKFRSFEEKHFSNWLKIGVLLCANWLGRVAWPERANSHTLINKTARTTAERAGPCFHSGKITNHLSSPTVRCQSFQRK